MQLHVSGRVALCECRFLRTGTPVLQLEMRDDAGQTLHVIHPYRDNSHASQHAARTLASRLRGQHVELDLVNPRFKSRRLEAEAPVITDPTQQLRKDLA